MGRHSFEHVTERCSKELEAVNTLLDGHDFITGSTPSAADCFLWSIIESVRRSLPRRPCALRSLPQRCSRSLCLH